MSNLLMELRILGAMEQTNTDWLLCNDLSHELGLVVDIDESLLILASSTNYFP